MEQQDNNDIHELYRATSLFLIAAGSIKFLQAKMSGELNPLELMKLDAEITGKMNRLNINPKKFQDPEFKRDLEDIAEAYDVLMNYFEEGEDVQTDSQD